MSDLIDVPLSALSDDALDGLIAEVVTRDGTDYGEIETSLETKLLQLKKALQRGEAKVVYDVANDYATIVPNKS